MNPCDTCFCWGFDEDTFEYRCFCEGDCSECGCEPVPCIPSDEGDLM